MGLLRDAKRLSARGSDKAIKVGCIHRLPVDLVQLQHKVRAEKRVIRGQRSRRNFFTLTTQSAKRIRLFCDELRMKA
jgi:hypothetical protein